MDEVRLLVVVRRTRRVFEGDAAACAEQMTSENSAVVIEAPADSSRDYEVTISGDAEDGLLLRVLSTDDMWATAVMRYLREQLDSGRPRWGFLRRSWLIFALSLTGIFAVTWNLLDLLAKVTTETGKYPDGGLAEALVLGCFVLSMVGGTALARWVLRWIPAFQVVEHGTQPRGTRVVTVLGAWIAAVVLSVGANFVTAAIQGAPV